MLNIQNISLQRGNKLLLNNASFQLYPKMKVGLIGKNGCGKSSLLALIRGEILPDQGEIFYPKHWKIASVKQETPSSPLSALDYVLSADNELKNIQAALKMAEEKNDGIQIAHLHTQLEEIGAYDINARASKLLSGLGFSDEEQKLAVKSFSGGWRMRLNLAQALIQRSDLLLLDEPTNHLDLETVLWLEQYLNSLDCALLLISHDRDFLNATTQQTVELAQQTLTLYGGNYDFYCQEKAVRLAHQAAQYAKQQAHIQHLQAFIERFRYKASKAKQVQSRIKALEKLEKITLGFLDSEVSFDFLPPENQPDMLIAMDNASVGYIADKPLINNIKLRIERGGRYGLLGVNGSGKTTLIKTLTGDLPTLSGSLNKAEKLKIGYFAQHSLDALRSDFSPVRHIQEISPDAKEQDIRNFLGGFAFYGDMALTPIVDFSGGEKARLALALLVWQKPNLLLLDEPTNHLDLTMRQALTIALQGFQGALLVVSHDRSLLDAVCDSFFLIEAGNLKAFDGSIDDYQNYRLSQNSQQNNKPMSSDRKKEKQQQAKERQEIANKIKPLKKIISECEQKLEQLLQEKQQAEVFIASEEAYNDENKTNLLTTTQRLGLLNQEIEATENRWLATQEEMENILSNKG
ncbi:MAG: ATP-binding cassette domain-containing protein [Neisseriaceae bacterium]|nr:ATP-binding cassette domain-containing protein [Neisseriaceae bacterium]